MKVRQRRGVRIAPGRVYLRVDGTGMENIPDCLHHLGALEVVSGARVNRLNESAGRGERPPAVPFVLIGRADEFLALSSHPNEADVRRGPRRSLTNGRAGRGRAAAGR